MDNLHMVNNINTIDTIDTLDTLDTIDSINKQIKDVDKRWTIKNEHKKMIERLENTYNNENNSMTFFSDEELDSDEDFDEDFDDEAKEQNNYILHKCNVDNTVPVIQQKETLIQRILNRGKNTQQLINDPINHKLGKIEYFKDNCKYDALQTKSGRIFYNNNFYNSISHWLKSSFDITI